MKSNLLLVLILNFSFVLTGCGTSSESRIDRLDRRIDTIGSESQTEFNNLRSQVRMLGERLDAHQQEIYRLRSKTSTFCVQTRNGEMRQLLPKGSRECDVP